MPAYKNKENGSWYVVTQYTDWTGERKPKCKRGFATRREALEWEQKFQQQSAGDLDMSFEAFCEIYTNDLKARLKESTWQTKENIIKTKLLPYHLNSENDFDEEIRQGLEQKLDAILNRQLYSQYKTAPTEEEREQARQEYLARRGVPQSYRWTTPPWEL